MKTRTFALFAFWTTLAGLLAFLPSWACVLGVASGRWPLSATNVALLAVAFAAVAVQQTLTSRVAAAIAGWFGAFDAHAARSSASAGPVGPRRGAAPAHAGARA